MVYPECEPGHDDDHHAGQVHGDHVVGELSGEHQLDLETAVLPGGGLHVTVVLPGGRQLEPARQTTSQADSHQPPGGSALQRLNMDDVDVIPPDVARELDGGLGLPHVDQVLPSPPVCRMKTQSSWLN